MSIFESDNFNTKKWSASSLLTMTLFDRLRWRFLITLLALLSAVFGLLGPFFQKLFVDRLLGAEPMLSAMSLATWPIVSLIACAFLSIVFSQATSMLSLYFGGREAVVMQRRFSDLVFEKALRLRPDTLKQRTVGEIVSIYATDTQSATALLEQSIPVGAAIFFPLVMGPLAIHFLFDVPLWTALLVTGVILVINFMLSSRQARFFSKFKSLAAERTGLVSEWIQNMRTLRILGWTESFEKKIFKKRIEETINRIRMVTNGQFMSSIGSSVNFFMNLLGVASLVYFKHGHVTPGELLAFLWILGVFLARPFRQIPWVFTFLLDALTSVYRLQDLLAMPTHDELDGGWSLVGSQTTTNSVAAPISLEPANLKVVDLNLMADKTPLLSHITFEIPKGSFVAVVGEVGSGKSLLALSLMGETQATFKEYRIGETDLLKQPIGTRRQYFSFVPQEGFVMSANLRDNVAFEYDAPHNQDENILGSLEQSQFRMSLENVEEGLRTEIGERGVNLSGGQRQRVSIARSHFYRRPIIILDDSLSAVDVDTEKKILDQLILGAWKDHIRILITHRLSVLRSVNKILFMKDGHLIEQGTFDDLFYRSPHFREFVRTLETKKEAAPEEPKPQVHTDTGESHVDPTVEAAVDDNLDESIERQTIH